jgi:hypothetical protein
MQGSSSPPTRRELALAAALLGAVALALYLPHVFQSGFYTDDWEIVAKSHLSHDLVGGAIDPLSQGYRPLAGVLLRTLAAIAGTQPSHYAVCGLGLSAVEGALLYAIVRRAGMAQLPAACAGALMVLAPWIDATRLWMVTYAESTAVCLVLGGMLAALGALRASPGWPRRARHALSLLLYLAGCLCFEGVIPIVAVAALLYAAVVPWRAALRRWPLDVFVAVVGFAGNISGGSRRGTDFSPGHLLTRVDEVSNATLNILDRALPLPSVADGPTGFVVVIVATLGLGILVGRRDRRIVAVRRWALTLLLGLAFAAAGLVALLPASSAFTPGWEGVDDRFSVAAAPGEVVALVAAAWLLGLGLATIVGRDRLTAPIAVALLAAMGIGLVSQERRSQAQWTLASQAQHHILDVVTRAVGPAPPPGTSVATFRHARTTQGNMPIFETSWDLKGALQVHYGDPTLRAHPVLPPITCGPAGMVYPDTGGPADRSTVLPYGNLIAVDIQTGAAVRVPNHAACSRELPLLLIP